jgi:hypothetical protein
VACTRASSASAAYGARPPLGCHFGSLARAIGGSEGLDICCRNVGIVRRPLRRRPKGRSEIGLACGPPKLSEIGQRGNEALCLRLAEPQPRIAPTAGQQRIENCKRHPRAAPSFCPLDLLGRLQ